jgi:tellurite resistance protein
MTADVQRPSLAEVPNSLGSKSAFPIGIFGISLGLAGLAGAWRAAVQFLQAPTWPAEALYAIAAAFWILFTVRYVSHSLRRPRSFRSNMTHPGVGPLTAYIPVIGILLASHYAAYLPTIGTVAVVVFVVVLGLIVVQLVAHWLQGNLDLDALHGGYFIPVVAGPFVASIGLDLVGLSSAASYAFGAALLFWFSFGTIIMFRHMTSTLPRTLVPTGAAFLAAPANASVAWIVAHPGPVDEPLKILAGFLFVMLAVQLAMIPKYRTTPFGLTFWIFVFPASSTSNFLIRWMAALDFGGWQVIAWIALGLATALASAVAVASVVSTTRRAMSRPEPQQENN